MKKDIKNLQIKLCYPIENIFGNIVNSITDTKIDNAKYPDKIFYFSNDKYIANYNIKIKQFWYNNDIFWSMFKINSLFKWQIINDLLNPMIEEHFKLKGITSISLLDVSYTLIEKNFKIN